MLVLVLQLWLLLQTFQLEFCAAQLKRRAAKSGIREWVDPETPENRHVYISSRGDPWELVMSDEFNRPGRDFRPGNDPVWTSLQKPDGTNDAMQVYTHDMASTVCDESEGTCFFQIEIREKLNNYTVYNTFKNPAGYENTTMKYEAAMLQSWNKFCIQGGMIEVRTRLPGIMTDINPDFRNYQRDNPLKTKEYYPTWPGIWMYGNLGRAIFTATNDRMWPYSYNECNLTVFDSVKNQRISACDGNPGHGLNPYQGRGAPEIDIIEAGGTGISSSIQIAPGMTKDFRMVKAHDEPKQKWCHYNSICETPGANFIGLPASLYRARGHSSWYQGLKYSSNNHCKRDPAAMQDLATVMKNVKKGIETNSCPATPADGDVNACPSSRDVNADFGLISPNVDREDNHWGVNPNGTCPAVMNFGYTGIFLCSRGNEECQTEEELAKGYPLQEPQFAYQMDAISANYDLHMAAYTEYVTFQLEWVMGKEGYLRWLFNGETVFEIPASALTNPPQDPTQMNPKKILPEEPMYLILNVAVSIAWASMPPNAPRACREFDPEKPVSEEERKKTIAICDAFPLYQRIDYVRVYQDLSKKSNMSIGCDPKSHPTRRYIQDHIDIYTDGDNPDITVVGGGACRNDDDCTVPSDRAKTGVCLNGRCKCTSDYWTGPRCILEVGAYAAEDGGQTIMNGWGSKSYGPSVVLTGLFAVIVVGLTLYMAVIVRKRHIKDESKSNVITKQRSKRLGNDGIKTPLGLSLDYDNMDNACAGPDKAFER